MSDSPAADLERSLYYGLVFMCLLYGMHLGEPRNDIPDRRPGFELYMFSHSLIIWSSTWGEARAQRRFYIIIGGLCALFTGICVVNNAVFMQYMWIERRNTPGGGPLVYLEENSSTWHQVWGTAGNVATNFIGDGLLVNVFVFLDSPSHITFPPDLSLLSDLESQHLRCRLSPPHLPRLHMCVDFSFL